MVFLSLETNKVLHNLKQIDLHYLLIFFLWTFNWLETLEFCYKKLLHEENNLVSDFQINPSYYETHNLNQSKKSLIILIYYDILDLF